MTSPGAIVFEREGRSWRLNVILDAPADRELFLMFAGTTITLPEVVAVNRQ